MIALLRNLSDKRVTDVKNINSILDKLHIVEIHLCTEHDEYRITNVMGMIFMVIICPYSATTEMQEKIDYSLIGL